MVALSSAMLVVALQAAQRTQTRPRPQTPQTPQTARPSSTYNAQDAAQIVQHAYRALLNRTPSAAEVSPAAAQVQAGNLVRLIGNMALSPEAQRVNAGKSSTQMVTQIFQGMLGRAPGAEGIQAYGALAQQRRYADIVLDIVTSPEFTSALSKPAGPAAGGQPAPDATAVSPALNAALSCEARVLDATLRDTHGHMYLTFDRMPDVTGQVVSGAAVDRFTHPVRPLTYRCDALNVSYAYDDREQPRGVTNGDDYPSTAVRHCETAVVSGQQFDAASLSASDTNVQYVLGLKGPTVHQCQMNGDQVVKVSIR